MTVSKELDYVKRILEYQPLTLNDRMIIEIILEKLQRLEEIDNANPSKAIKCLEKLDNSNYFFSKPTPEDKVNEIANCFKTIRQALLNYQKSEQEIDRLDNKCLDILADNIRLKKILNIIKEKCLHTDNLNYVAVCINYDMYKEKMSNKHDTKVVKINWNDKVILDALRLLTEKEFDLLKEMTNNAKDQG